MADVILHPRAIKFSLPSLYARRHSREIAYQALPLFLRATLKSWEWPGDEARQCTVQLSHCILYSNAVKEEGA